jgi:hypothetical protein
MRKNGTHQAFL